MAGKKDGKKDEKKEEKKAAPAAAPGPKKKQPKKDETYAQHMMSMVRGTDETTDVIVGAMSEKLREKGWDTDSLKEKFMQKLGTLRTKKDGEKEQLDKLEQTVKGLKAGISPADAASTPAVQMSAAPNSVVDAKQEAKEGIAENLGVDKEDSKDNAKGLKVGNADDAEPDMQNDQSPTPSPGNS